MPQPRYTVEGARQKDLLLQRILSDSDVGPKAKRELNIIAQTPDDEIMPLVNKLLESNADPAKLKTAIANYEKNTFLDYRPVPWDEIHHQRGLDIFSSVRRLPVDERPVALDLMDQSGHTLGDTRNNLLGTSFDVRTHTGGAFKGKTRDGLKVREALSLNEGVVELSAHPFGTKETRAGVIVPDFDNAGSWFNHAQQSAKTVEIDAARGIAIEQPRRHIVNKVLQSGRGAPPISAFDIFTAEPREVRAAAAYFNAPEQEKARLAIYKSWKIPKNLDPALLPTGLDANNLPKHLAKYFPADMLKLGAALPVLGAAFDAHAAVAGTNEAVKAKSNRQKLAGALDAVSGGTGLASLAPSPASVPLGIASVGAGLLSSAVRNNVDTKAIKAAPKAVKAVSKAEKTLNPVHHAITNEAKYRGKQLLKILGIK